MIHFKRALARASRMVGARLGGNRQIYVQHRIAEYRAMWEAVAREMGASFTALAEDLWELQLEGRKMRVLNDIMELDNPVTLEVAGRKPLVYSLLREHGLRVPDHVVVSLENLGPAYEFVRAHPAGCVVKPAHGTSSGMGITTHVRTIRDTERAAILASFYCPEILVEPQVFGESFRLLILRGKMIHAVRRRGIRLTGNGTDSIGALLQKENAERARSNLPPIAIDRDCTFTLEAQALSLGSVLGNGITVLAKTASDGRSERVELRTVYNEEVTEMIGDQLRANAELAASVIGSEFVGVDFITGDPSVSLEKSGGVVNELNTTPGLHHHYFDVGERIPPPALAIATILLRGG